MTALTTFADTSGKVPKSHVVVTAGLFASESDWLAFSTEWQAAIDAEGLTVHHSTDAQALTEDYLGWDLDRFRAYQKVLYRISGHHPGVQGFAAFVLRDTYNEMNARYELEEHGYTPFTLAAGYCITSIERRSQGFDPKPDEMLYLHETEDERHEVDLTRVLRVEGLHVDFRAKVSKNGHPLVPLQLADFVAWPIRRALENKLASPDPMNKDLRAYYVAARGLDVVPVQFGRAHMRLLVKDKAIAPRS